MKTYIPITMPIMVKIENIIIINHKIFSLIHHLSIRSVMHSSMGGRGFPEAKVLPTSDLRRFA